MSYLGSDNDDEDGGNDRAEELMIWQDETSLVCLVVVRPWHKCFMRTAIACEIMVGITETVIAINFSCFNLEVPI